VAAFRFSRRAEADLLSIGDYTLRTWGKAQATRYLGELEVCCQTLSDNPTLGRLCDEVRPAVLVSAFCLFALPIQHLSGK